MSRESQESIPTVYEIKVKGHLEERWADWFGGLTFSHGSDGTTTLRGTIADQAALHGLLNGIRDLGLPLVSVQQIHLDEEKRSDPNEKG